MNLPARIGVLMLVGASLAGCGAPLDASDMELASLAVTKP
jgi:hypothetical protein